jgi:epoxyqueuosine reductase
MTTQELTKKIKEYALNGAGFDLVGFSSSELPSLYGDAMGKWVANGFAGNMEYMTRDGGAARTNTQKVLPGAKSVISLAINYFQDGASKPDTQVGRVARYAYGADYHKVIEKKLKQLSSFILKISPHTKKKAYVDTGPIAEKAFAKEAGLGFFGKNTNIITRNYGSWVFLASLLTNLELEYDAPHLGACGSCRICIDACPTGALLGDYQLDARKCISYLTIESKEEHPASLKKGIGEWAFGCDICQEVCPYNFRAKTTRHEEFLEKKSRYLD